MAHERWNDLRGFLRFVAEKLETSGESLTLDDVLDLWEYENSCEEEREETLKAIRRGLDDMYAGRTRPVEEFDREFRERYGLPPRE